MEDFCVPLPFEKQNSIYTICSPLRFFHSEIIRDSLVARITACRAVDRGSIPRRGAFRRKWFSGKIQRCHRWAPGSIPGLRILFEVYLFD